MTRVVVEEFQVEMVWVCPCSGCYQVNPGFTGDEWESLKCSKCGYVKEDKDPYVFPAEVKRLQAEYEAKANAGADWICKDYCGKSNRAWRLVCENCGAKRPVATGGTYERVEVPGLRPTPKPEALEISESHKTRKPEQVKVEPFPRRVSALSTPLPAVPARKVAPAVPQDFDDLRVPERKFPWGWPIAITALLALASFLIWLFGPNHTVAEVAGLQWSRTEVLEEQRDYVGEGWRDEAQRNHEIFAWGVCEDRWDGSYHRCDPYRCRPRQVDDPTRCTGGGVIDCRCGDVEEAYDAGCSPGRDCSTTCTPNRNGTARCRRSCNLECRSGTHTVRHCDRCPVPRVCEKMTVYETCYNQCQTIRTWCSYSYHQWERVASRTNTGVDHAVMWPGLQALGPRQRLLRTEQFQVRFTEVSDPTRSWVNSVSVSDYARYNLGQKWDVEWSRGSHSCNPLRPSATR